MSLPGVSGSVDMVLAAVRPPATMPARRCRRCRHGGCAGRAMTGVTKGCARSASSSAGAKPPSGPTSSAAGRWHGTDGAARRSARWRRTGAARPASRTARVERPRRVQARDGQALALLGRLDGDGGQPVRVHPMRVAALGDAPAAARRRRARSPSARRDRWHRASAARTASHRSGSGACGRSCRSTASSVARSRRSVSMRAGELAVACR